MIVRTHWEQYNHFYCPSGERIEMRHRAVLHKNGERELVKDVAKNTFDIIQSHKEECLIENILKRCLEGDLRALDVMHGQYTDITGAPNSLAEAQQIIIRLKNEFDELPKDIRKEFDYNVEKYIAEFGSEEWAKKTGVADKIAAEKAAIEAKQKLNDDFAKAVENIASGNMNTTGKETSQYE